VRVNIEREAGTEKRLISNYYFIRPDCCVLMFKGKKKRVIGFLFPVPTIPSSAFMPEQYGIVCGSIWRADSTAWL